MSEAKILEPIGGKGHREMGRLSKLQKHILIEAYKKLILKNGTCYLERWTEQKLGWDYFFKGEIFKSYYGWEERYIWIDGQRETYFSKYEVGDKEYHKAHVTVSRSLHNLMDKGLITIWDAVYSGWTGIKLTDKGIETAQKLLNVKT